MKSSTVYRYGVSKRGFFVDVANYTDRTRINGLCIPCKFSRIYTVYTSTVFNGVVSYKVRQTSVPDSHKCKTSPEKIRSQKPEVGSLSLTGQLQISLPCLVDVNIIGIQFTPQLSSTVQFPARYGRIARPIITSASRHQPKYKVNNQKSKQSLLCGQLKSSIRGQ